MTRARDRTVAGAREREADERPDVRSVVEGVDVLDEPRLQAGSARETMSEADGGLQGHLPEIVSRTEGERPARPQELRDETRARSGREGVGEEGAPRVLDRQARRQTPVAEDVVGNTGMERRTRPTLRGTEGTPIVG